MVEYTFNHSIGEGEASRVCMLAQLSFSAASAISKNTTAAADSDSDSDSGDDL